MDQSLVEVSVGLLRSSLDLKAGETLLVVADEAKKEIGAALREAGSRLEAESLLLVMDVREKDGQEPPSAVSEAMKHADVVVCATERSLTHTRARREAAAQGARLATMPSITRDMFMEGAITADYNQVQELTERVTERLSRGQSVRIEKEGRALTLSIDGRSGVPSTGVYRKPGESGNLPSGEAYIAPMEGTGNGQLVVDGSIAGIGKVTGPLLVTVEEGRLVDAQGPEATRLLGILGDGKGRNLAEFGIGTNPKARITGIVLEDEKVYGTIHVAFGSNHTFGGTVDAGVHIDLIVARPDVYIDDVLIMKQGKLQL